MTAVAELSERDLIAIFRRALVTVTVCALVGLPIIARAWGWRSMVLYLIGAVIAATGIVEWRRLTKAIFARLESRPEASAKPPRAMAPVLVLFFLRLLAAGVLLYVSLRSLNGRPIALILGLALAMFALTLEALRLIRSWSA